METCQEYANYFSEYLDQELSIQQKAKIQKHLEVCEFCRKNLAEMQEAWQMLDEYQVFTNNEQDTIRKFYSKTLPAVFLQCRIQPFSLWLYGKSILAGIVCGILLYIAFKDIVPQNHLRQNFSILNHPDFDMIENLEILENYEIFEHFSLEKLKSWKSKN